MSTNRWYHNFLSRIDAKRALGDKADALKCEKQAISEQMMGAKSRLPRVRQEIQSLEATVANASESGRNQWQRRLEAAQAEAAQLSKTVANGEARMQAITTELEQMTADMDNCGKGASVDELRAHLKSVAEAKAEVERIEGIKAEQEGILASLDDDRDERIEALQKQRSQVLADIALGNATKAALETIDAEIDGLLQDKSGDHVRSIESHRQAHQTLVGLDSRLEQARAHYTRLSGYTNELLTQALRSEAERVGEAYFAHAKEAIDAFQELVAIDRILGNAAGDGSASFLPPAWWHMNLPAFMLECAKYIEPHDAMSGVLYSALRATDGGMLDASETVMRDRLREKGFPV